MAEGHTVAAWARDLQVLVGERLERVDLPATKAEWLPAIEGQALEAVESRGKNLLLYISGGLVIRCHALMYGSWQVGEPGMELRKLERQVRLRLRTARHEAVFFNGPVVDIMTVEDLATYEPIQSLGPDVMSDDFDRDEAWRRLQRHPQVEIAVALLDQTIVAGIGNIFKSEALFAAAVNPRAPVAWISRAEADRIWTVVTGMMRANITVTGPLCTTTPELIGEGRRLYVYRQTNKPCAPLPDRRRCEGLVEQFRQGRHPRTTYWCPSCQRQPERALAADR